LTLASAANLVVANLGVLQLRSTDNYPNYGPFDEIDYEFVNQAGRACSIWLNSWAG
jgi:hypothetical protein